MQNFYMKELIANAPINKQLPLGKKKKTSMSITVNYYHHLKVKLIN